MDSFLTLGKTYNEADELLKLNCQVSLCIRVVEALELYPVQLLFWLVKPMFFHVDSYISSSNTLPHVCWVCKLFRLSSVLCCVVCVWQVRITHFISAESFEIYCTTVRVFLFGWLVWFCFSDSNKLFCFRNAKFGGKQWAYSVTCFQDECLWVMEQDCSLSYTGGWKVLIWSATVMDRNWGFRCKFQIHIHIYENSQALACVKLAITVFQMVL